MQDILGDEYGGMNEVLYNVAAATDNDQWAKAGDRFTQEALLQSRWRCGATNCAGCT